MTPQRFKSEAIDLAVTYLAHNKFGNVSWLQAYALEKGARWIIDNHSDTIGNFIWDSMRLMTVFAKMKTFPEEAMEDYRELKRDRAILGGFGADSPQG